MTRASVVVVARAIAQADIHHVLTVNDGHVAVVIIIIWDFNRGSCIVLSCLDIVHVEVEVPESIAVTVLFLNVDEVTVELVTDFNVPGVNPLYEVIRFNEDEVL
jgi:hypothetical protein